MIRVAVIGAGYWGPNLIRNFAACPETELVAVCDRDQQRLTQVLRPYPGVEAITDFEQLLDRADIDAVAIATPVNTHAPLGVAALQAGKHVLVEKPLAGSVADAEQMVEAAAAANRVLMVDHTFIYSGPVQRIKQIVDSGEIGDLYFVDSVRINLGMFQHDVNVVWDLAPHDLSILDFLVGRLPRSISAFGACHANEAADIEDVAYLNLDFSDGLLASFHVNWLSPVKVRHFIIGGSEKSIVYDDLEPTERIKVYDRGITVSDDVEAKRGVMIGYRTGDVWSPHVPQVEPLAKMVSHFAECIQQGKQPLTDGESGLRVVRILEAAQRSIKAQGGRITIWDDLQIRRAA
ncbi:MAG: Gfo/Idh/MocA family oxidoreductase [Planctomycetales bacterium]|nr:Gfo/Idh/MocA family oxidoreductase [Planctomycetales bacterium]